MYTAHGTLQKDQYVTRFAPLVKKIAYHMMAKLPASVQVDDLIQVGMIGLLDAANNFDGAQGAQFETYAAQRIRGAMLDELRHSDWLPRSARKNMRRIEAAMNALEQRLGRSPSDSEVAKELQLSLEDYQQMLFEAHGSQLLHYEDFQQDGEDEFLGHFNVGDGGNPLGILEDAGFRIRLVEAIKQLPEREQLLMALYYEEELNLKEIGAVLGVSESRVCQLHSQAVARLRVFMKGWVDKGG
ncbi:MAG: RNA polymerase sigma factor FliA [Sulfuricella sp.]|nr:RNA polymerase sigma factor FliA [Sulfuricella sp.]